MAHAKVPVVMGSLANDVGLAASAVIERGGGTYFETTAVSEEFTTGKTHVFRASTAGSKMGEIAIQFAAHYAEKVLDLPLKSTTLAIAFEPNWKLIAKSARATARLLGLKTVLFSEFKSTPEGCAEIVKDMRNAGAKIVVAGGWVNDAVCLANSAKRIGFKPDAWIGLSGGHGIDKFAQCLGGEANGIFVVSSSMVVPDSSLTEQGRLLKKEVLRRWESRRPGQTPSSLAWEAFCNAWVLMNEALPRARSMSAVDVREALLRINLPEGTLPNGSGVLFDRNGSNQKAFYTVKQWFGGTLSTSWGAVYRVHRAIRSGAQ
jgi:branched-chain amino acid transport system substrate-binding protein